VCLHITWKAHVPCDLNFIVKDKGQGHRHCTYTGKVVISQKQC